MTMATIGGTRQAAGGGALAPRRVQLGVNIDHVATLRQARGTAYPDPVFAALLVESAGADQITIHLREDRRHIVDRDLEVLRRVVRVPLNLEMAATDEMVAIALRERPDVVTLVPERRQERTTEGGLDVVGQREALRPLVARLSDAGIVVSLFVDADPGQVASARELGAATVELHTGDYCDAPTAALASQRLESLRAAALQAHGLGLRVAAGHGLELRNVAPVAQLPHVEELNIGHSIVARAVFVGLDAAVREMVAAIAAARVGDGG